MISPSFQNGRQQTAFGVMDLPEAEELQVSQRPSISSAQLYLRTSSCSLVTLFEGWWQDLHCSHRKTLHSAKDKNAKKSENPLRGNTSCATALRRATHRMTGLGQSLREPHSLMIGGKPRGNLTGSGCGRVLGWC